MRIAEPPPPVPSGQRIDVGGFALNVRRVPSTAAPGAPTIVLLHGFGASNATWQDIERELAAAGPLVEIDLKGFGWSDHPRDGRYTVEDQRDAVVRVIRELGLRRVVLMGHSYGGGVALMTYFHLRDSLPSVTVEKLVLIDAASYPQELPFFIENLTDPVMRWLAFNILSAETRARYTLERVTRAPGAPSREMIRRYTYFFELPGSDAAMVEAARKIVPADHEKFIARFPTIAVPTLILWGEKDPVIPVEFGRRLDAEIPRSELHVFPETGHVPHEERPAEVLPVLLRFLRDASRGAVGGG